MSEVREEQRLPHELQFRPRPHPPPPNSSPAQLTLYNLIGPIVRFMLENITKLNGKMDNSNIRCMPCENFQSGGFSPEYGVLLCQNRLRDRGHTEDTLAHELVHVYDHLRFRVDWEELKHHACSEVYITPGIRISDHWMVRPRRLTPFLRRLDADSGVKFEWGVPVDEGGVYERRFRLHKTASSVRQETSHSVCAE